MLPKSLECVKCGACCLGVTLPLVPADMSNLVKEQTGIPLENTRAECRVNGVCKHLDLETRQCKDYENRPEECHRFKCWENQAWLFHFFTIYRIATQGGYRNFDQFVEFVDLVEQRLKELNDGNK